MHYKKLTQKFLLILIGLILLLIIPVIVYDPLHIYHKSWFSDESKLHSKNMRLQNAGIINNYEFDSILAGTSMFKYIPSSYASHKLGGKFVNLSASGGNLYERNLFIKHALRKKSIKNIIYSFDTALDANLQKNNRSLPLNKFNYLYDTNPYNDFYAYWNKKFLTCTLTFSSSTECIGDTRGLVRPLKWFEDGLKINEKKSGIDNWISKNGRGRNMYSRIKKQIDRPLTKKEYQKNLNLTYQIIDEQLLKTIKQNPNVPFHIVFPPYSRLQYALWAKYNPRQYTLYKQTIKYLFTASMQYDNMYVYLLDHLEVVDNLNNYIDMRHSTAKINHVIIDYIYDKKYIHTINELSILFREIDLKNQSYTRLDSDIAQILNAYKFKYSLIRKNDETGVTIEGWALSYKVTNVELHVNNKKVKSIRLKKREDVFEEYPAYAQLKSGFLFKDIKLKSKNGKLTLVFKNKNKIIKKITILNKEGVQSEK